MVATETSLPAATLGHLALAEKQYLGLTFLQVLLMLVDMHMVYTYMLVDMVTITLLTSFSFLSLEPVCFKSGRSQLCEPSIR